MITTSLFDLPLLSARTVTLLGDPFDTYTVADSSGVLNDGFGFSAKWTITDGDFGALIGDNFDGYTVGSATTGTLNSGTGFSAAWEFA